MPCLQRSSVHVFLTSRRVKPDQGHLKIHLTREMTLHPGAFTATCVSNQVGFGYKE